jgi:hypothetical protein
LIVGVGAAFVSGVTEAFAFVVEFTGDGTSAKK